MSVLPTPSPLRLSTHIRPESVRPRMIMRGEEMVPRTETYLGAFKKVQSRTTKSTSLGPMIRGLDCRARDSRGQDRPTRTSYDTIWIVSFFSPQQRLLVWASLRDSQFPPLFLTPLAHSHSQLSLFCTLKRARDSICCRIASVYSRCPGRCFLVPHPRR